MRILLQMQLIQFKLVHLVTPKVMSGVTIKVTNTDGEESQVDVETVDPRPLSPRKLSANIKLNGIIRTRPKLHLINHVS